MLVQLLNVWAHNTGNFVVLPKTSGFLTGTYLLQDYYVKRLKYCHQIKADKFSKSFCSKYIGNLAIVFAQNFQKWSRNCYFSCIIIQLGNTICIKYKFSLELSSSIDSFLSSSVKSSRIAFSAFNSCFSRFDFPLSIKIVWWYKMFKRSMNQKCLEVASYC